MKCRGRPLCLPFWFHKLMAKTHYTIPFFIPHNGCPHRCVFCDQRKITGERMIEPREVAERIERYLSTMTLPGARVEVGFFGGTFTGLPLGLQDEFLRPVQKYMNAGRIDAIRLSTRPDYINEDILSFLKTRGVGIIELGVQSMSEKVLRAARRGHTAEDIERSSRMIVRQGFKLGHQMMVGLPLGTADDEYFTARRAGELGAGEVRIYPVVVMKGTELAEEWADGKYSPLAEEEAARRCALLILYFDSKGIKVIRCGLHPSEGLMRGKDLLSGPFHPAFRLKAESRIFSLMLEHIFNETYGKSPRVCYNPKDEAAFFGFERENLPWIKKISAGKKELYDKDKNVPRGCLLVDRGEEAFIVDREKIAERVLPESLLKPMRVNVSPDCHSERSEESLPGVQCLFRSDT